MKSSREIQEEIDALAVEGKAIADAAKATGRELTSEESERITDIVDTLIPQQKKDLANAKGREEQQRKLAADLALQSKVSSLSDTVENGLQRNAVAPIGMQVEREPQVYNRIARLQAFKSDRDAYNAGMFLRAVVGREYNRNDIQAEQHCQKLGWRITNAGTEGSGSAGGYLVPTPLSQTIVDVRESVGVMRRLLNVMPMTSDTLTVAKRSGGLTVYGGGEAPSADMTASDKSWKQVKLVADKRYVVHQLSQELTDDAIINVVDDAVMEMGYALALAEDTEAISGDGTSTYRGVTGIVNAIGSAGVYTAGSGDDTWGELAMVDFTGTMGKLPSKFWNGQLSWVCSSAFYHTVMLRVLAEAGGNTISTLQAGDAGARFMGYPVYFTDRLPTATAASTKHAYFGNWRELGMIGDRGAVRVARSDDFAFLRDLTTIKATSRYDIVLHEPGDSSNAGAVVALSTNS